jgi:hypothetical protein
MITTQPADTMRLSCSPHTVWPVWQQINIIFTQDILAWIPLLLQWNDQFHKYSLLHRRTKPNRNHICWFTYKTPIEKNSSQLHAWTFIQKWQSAGSLWYKWENPRKINKSVKDFDFPHLSYCYLWMNLMGKANNNSYNTKFSINKHVKLKLTTTQATKGV